MSLIKLDTNIHLYELVLDVSVLDEPCILYYKTQAHYSLKYRASSLTIGRGGPGHWTGCLYAFVNPRVDKVKVKMGDYAILW